MTDTSVFLVTELWVIPGSFPLMKKYRKRLNDILEKYRPKYIFHNHAFEWVTGDNSEDYPAGIEIIKFENEEIARSALAELDKNGLKGIEKEIFSRIRCYLSRYAFPDSLVDEIYKQTN